MFAKNATTGECASGLYLWASDMILVEHITANVIRDTVLALINDEFETAFTELEPLGRDAPAAAAEHDALS